MNKFINSLLVLVCAFLTMNSCFAENQITVNGTTFELKYSNCNAITPVCRNEYYKKNEYDMNWTELFTVVYEKGVTNPHEYAQSMKNTQKNSTWLEQKDNYDILSFYIPFNVGNDTYYEQNIAKIMKSKDGKGSISTQYAVRLKYDENNKDEINKKMTEIANRYKAFLASLPALDILKTPLKKW